MTGRGEPGPGEWLPWAGGECPVEDMEFVHCVWLDEGFCVEEFGHACEFYWDHNGEDADIIAYRIVAP